MILNCTYSTNSDVGIFESNAKLNLKTGKVFDIEICQDDDQEGMETVYSEDISFNFEGKEYTFEVEFKDSYYALKYEKDLKTIQSIKLATKLEKVLPEKAKIKNQSKI